MGEYVWLPRARFFPLPWKRQQPSARLAGMSLWHLSCLSSFQTGVVTHLPAPVGSRLPTP